MDEHLPATDQEQELSDVLVACLEAEQDGGSLDRPALLARYPQFAQELERFFAQWERFDRLAAPLREVARAASSAMDQPAPTVNEPSNQPSETPLRSFRDFEILEEIGRGGMGVVYKARQTSPHRLLALKMIRAAELASPADVQRFRNEAEAAAQLDHPHIVPIYEVGEHEGRCFFSMKLIGSGSLATQADRFTADPRAAAVLVTAIAQAVHHAHQRGVLHRDLKPSNILLDLDNRPHVTDFGLAKWEGADLSLTETGAIVGTPSYMAPEQAAPSLRPSPGPTGGRRASTTTATDVYGLGALLYTLLCGRPPFKGQTVLETLEQVKSQEPEPPSRSNRRVDRNLETICLKCLAKDPRRRYSSAEDLADDLGRWLSGEPVRARRTGVAERVVKWARRRPGATAALTVALIALLLGGGTGIWWLQKRAAAEGEARAALREAIGLLEEERWPEALSAARRAEGVLPGVGADADLRRQARRLVEDLEMASRLQEARLQGAAVKDGHFDSEATDEAYVKAFQEYGLDVDGLDLQAAADQIHSRPINRQLVAALDDWALARQALKTEGWKQRLAVARAVDPDMWRNRLRDVLDAKGRKTLEEVIAAGPAGDWPVPTLELLCMVARRAASGERVAALLGRAQQRHPDDFWINETLGALAQQVRPPRLDEAIRFRSVAVALRPQSPGARLNLGSALRDSGRLDEAIASYRDAIRLKNDYAEAHDNLGNALAAKGGLEEAIAEYREAIRFKKNCHSAHNNLGRALAETDQLEAAIVEYREALHVKLDYPQAHNSLGAALVKKGQLDEAIAEFRKAIGIKKDLAEAHTNLGGALVAKGLLNEAIDECRKAIDLKKDFDEAHNNLGSALAAKGLLDQAIPQFREAIRLKKNFAGYHCNFGLALQNAGRLDEAIAEYREAIRIKQVHAEAHNCLGNALEAKVRLLGNTGETKVLVEEAVAECRKAVGCKKEYPEAHYNLGNALWRQKTFPQAVAAYEEAIRLKKDYPEAHCNLGQVLQKQGRYLEALAAIRRGHELGSKRPDWSYPSARWVRQAELLVACAEKLPAILKGGARPQDAAEGLVLARMCYDRAYHVAAARLWTDAFAADPKLTRNLNEQHRYNAACAGALAGCGQGQDADKLDPKERDGLREQALNWLRGDLKAYRQAMIESADKAGPVVAQRMQRWLLDTDFIGVRGPKALSRLPEPERSKWQRLWEEVEALRQRAVKPAQPATPARP